MNVGFIGLGVMGRPMAQHLQRAGHRLHLWARRPETLAPFAGGDAVVHRSPAALAAATEMAFTVVTASADVETLAIGADGLVAGARPGWIHVDMSTIAPATARRVAAAFAARGALSLDAPVSGGERGAIDATLAIMVGGSGEALARVRPLLECLGRTIVHVGDSGAGQVAKACNQMVVAATIEVVAEAITFARKSGVDAAKVREALLGGFAYSKILEVHGKRMLDADFKPGFKAKLHQKDMRIVLEDAATLGLALPAAAFAAQQINAVVGAGDGELDSSAVYKVLERMHPK